MKRERPDVVLMRLDQNGLLQAPGVRAPLATALFPVGELSLVRAAHVAGLDTLEQWIQSSSPTAAR